jgi:hypothetical protein
MFTKSMFIGVLVAVAAVTASAQSPAPASAPPHVTRVLVIEGNVGKLIEIAKRARAITDKAGVQGKARLWNVVFGGPEAGRTVIAVEYPSLAALAAADAKLQANPDWMKMNADAAAGGLKLVSSSLVSEVPY